MSEQYIKVFQINRFFNHFINLLWTFASYCIFYNCSNSLRRRTGVPLERYNVDTNQWTNITSCGGTLPGGSLGHYVLLPDRPNILYALGHERQKALEHEVCGFLVDLSVGWVRRCPLIRDSRTTPHAIFCHGSCLVLLSICWFQPQYSCM